MNRYLTMIVSVAFLFIACESADDNVQQPEDGAVVLVTRAEEGENASPVDAGLFMVLYNGEKKGFLQEDLNYVNNLLLRFSDNSWSLSEPIYWPDSETKCDFYAYAPYRENVENAKKMLFRIECDQSSDENLAKSDFLWGTIQDRTPTASGLDLRLSHMFSKLTVLVAGESGFKISNDDVSVSIGGTYNSAIIDLESGMVTPAGEKHDVLCNNSGNLEYTAILVPQQLAYCDFIKIDWMGMQYVLQTAMKLSPNKKYTLTVKLKKTESGFDVGIDGWDIVDEDFGGTVGG